MFSLCFRGSGIAFGVLVSALCWSGSGLDETCGVGVPCSTQASGHVGDIGAVCGTQAALGDGVTVVVFAVVVDGHERRVGVELQEPFGGFGHEFFGFDGGDEDAIYFDYEGGLECQGDLPLHFGEQRFSLYSEEVALEG